MKIGGQFLVCASYPPGYRLPSSILAKNIELSMSSSDSAVRIYYLRMRLETSAVSTLILGTKYISYECLRNAIFFFVLGFSCVVQLNRS